MTHTIGNPVPSEEPLSVSNFGPGTFFAWHCPDSDAVGSWGFLVDYSFEEDIWVDLESGRCDDLFHSDDGITTGYNLSVSVVLHDASETEVSFDVEGETVTALGRTLSREEAEVLTQQLAHALHTFDNQISKVYTEDELAEDPALVQEAATFHGSVDIIDDEGAVKFSLRAMEPALPR